MVNQFLEKIHQSFANYFQKQKKPIMLDGKVMEITPDFIIVGDGRYRIKCYLEEKDIEIGHFIRLTGFVDIDGNYHLYVKVNYYYSLNQEYWFQKDLASYHKLKLYLEQKKITRKREHPNRIDRVGLIVLPNYRPEENSFEINFKDNCFGKLFVYRLNMNEMNTDLVSAIKYLKNKTDMICLLFNKYNIHELINLSTDINIRYFMKTKKIPYIVSISNIPQDDKMPLLTKVVDQNFNNANDAIQFIRESQIQYRQKIDSMIGIGINKVGNILTGYQQKLFKYQLYISELYAEDKLEIKEHPFSKIKRELSNALEEKKKWMENIRYLMADFVINSMEKKNNIKQISMKQNEYVQMFPDKLPSMMIQHENLINEIKKIEN